MTLKREGDLDILKMYLYTENEFVMLRHSKLLIEDDICMVNEKEYENSSQGQRSRSNVTILEPLLVFTMGHIPGKLRQFLICSFELLCGQTDAQIPPKTIPCSMRAGNSRISIPPSGHNFRGRTSFH